MVLGKVPLLKLWSTTAFATRYERERTANKICGWAPRDKEPPLPFFFSDTSNF